MLKVLIGLNIFFLSGYLSISIYENRAIIISNLLFFKNKASEIIRLKVGSITNISNKLVVFKNNVSGRIPGITKFMAKTKIIDNNNFLKL